MKTDEYTARVAEWQHAAVFAAKLAVWRERLAVLRLCVPVFTFGLLCFAFGWLGCLLTLWEVAP